VARRCAALGARVVAVRRTAEADHRLDLETVGGGAALGGDRNERIETAVPGALAGLAVGTPVGVYVQTGRPSRYLWGAAGVLGAVAAGTAVYLSE
jgi:hypothetical protein